VAGASHEPEAGSGDFGRFRRQREYLGFPSKPAAHSQVRSLYVADSQSNATQNHSFKRGIRIGRAKDDKFTALIPFVEPDPDKINNAGMEGVTAHAVDNVYGGQATTPTPKKYIKGKISRI
jgi:hypothetical protein